MYEAEVDPGEMPSGPPGISCRIWTLQVDRFDR